MGGPRKESAAARFLVHRASFHAVKVATDSVIPSPKQNFASFWAAKVDRFVGCGASNGHHTASCRSVKECR